MRIAPTIIVLVLAAAGCVLVWRGGMMGTPGAATQTNDRTASRRLITDAQLPVSSITSITLKRAGETTLVYERQGTEWVQTQPFSHTMEPFSIRQLAQQVQEMEFIDVIQPADLRDGLSLASLSLQPPAAELTFQWLDGTMNLELGRRSVAGRAFLRIGGDDRIHIVNQKLHERVIDMDPREWRSRTIFPGAGVESTQIEWRNGPARMAIQRDRKQWMMVEPVRTRLDPAARDQFMDAIGRAVVSGFILDQPSVMDLERFSLYESPISMTISVGEHIQRMTVGARAGGGTQDFFGVIEGRPTVVRIGGAVLAALFRQPQDLMAHTASGVVPADVKSIVIRDAPDAAELRLERNLETWHMKGGSTDEPDHKINPTHVQVLLDQLTTLRAVSVQIVEQYPRELEVATITLHGFDGKAIDTVRVIREKETQRWGMENGDNVIRWYPASLEMKLTSAAFGSE